VSPEVEIAVIIAAVVISGFINTLASSGSAVTLPLMILIGLPATVANGTNRLPILAGAIAALITFHRAGVIDWRNGLLLSIPVVAGTSAARRWPRCSTRRRWAGPWSSRLSPPSRCW
jgi:hypothetical protein